MMTVVLSVSVRIGVCGVPPVPEGHHHFRKCLLILVIRDATGIYHHVLFILSMGKPGMYNQLSKASIESFVPIYQMVQCRCHCHAIYYVVFFAPRSRVNSPHQGQWRGALMFHLIYAWINGWVNNRDTGDLRRHRAHDDVTVIIFQDPYLHLTTLIFQCLYFILVAAQFICSLWPDLQAMDGPTKSISDSDDERKPLFDEKKKVQDDVEPGLVCKLLNDMMVLSSKRFHI